MSDSATWQRWNDDTRKILELALREALSLGHNYIGPEHVLLAMIRPEAPDSVARRVLKDVDVRTLVIREVTKQPRQRPRRFEYEASDRRRYTVQEITELRDACQVLDFRRHVHSGGAATEAMVHTYMQQGVRAAEVYAVAGFRPVIDADGIPTFEPTEQPESEGEGHV